MGPYFPSHQPRNITVHQEAIAYLPCTVNQLGDKSVSWVRQRDADILTVDRYTFVRDDRLTVHFTPDTSTWTLVIKYVQERDAGAYECQISTEPKMAMLVHLNVIVPQVEVKGASDKYVRSGSTARLECKVSSTVQLPDYIFWYHLGERLLEYDNPRVKMTVSRRGGQGSEMSIISTLIISNAEPSDAGNYTCLPSNLHSATTLLHVLNEEQPAAMHTGSAIMREPPGALGVLLVVAVTLVFVHTHHHHDTTTTHHHHGAITTHHNQGATTSHEYHDAITTHDHHCAITTNDHYGATAPTITTVQLPPMTTSVLPPPPQSTTSKMQLPPTTAAMIPPPTTQPPTTTTMLPPPTASLWPPQTTIP
ncbi:zwei Ig domain protein zig-8-like isoform X2 [Homarus americanus]|nr:zwei Ig domain protein zig-8-like isoform X2 [Homarus americanus]